MKVVGNFSAWSVYERDYHVMDIPGDLVTHINYAFMNVVDGECVLGDTVADVERSYPGDSFEAGATRGSFHQLELFKEDHPHVRTLLSIGGYLWSGEFSDVALTDESRVKFAESCAELASRYGFDGLDIVWLFPVGGGLETNVVRPEDKHNFTRLLRELRRVLTARGERENRAEPYLLTMASGRTPETFMNLELSEIDEVVDWINLLSYDFHGSWQATTGHNAPMDSGASDMTGYAVSDAVESMIASGVSPERIVMGVPFFGATWSGVSGDLGLGADAEGPGPGTYEPGHLQWRDIKRTFLTDSAFTRGYDGTAEVPFLYDPDGGIFISYDDEESMAVKREYALEHGLGGVFVSELHADDTSNTLLRVLNDL